MKVCKGIVSSSGKRCSFPALNGLYCHRHDPKKQAWRIKNTARASKFRNGQMRAAKKGPVRAKKRAVQADPHAEFARAFSAVVAAAVRSELKAMLSEEL